VTHIVGVRQVVAASAAREWSFLRGSPWDFALATWVPGACLVMLAWLFTSGVARKVPIAVVDQDHGAVSRSLIRSLDAAPGIRVAAQPANLEQAWSLARKLDVYAIAYVPEDASRDGARTGSATVFAYYNASYRIASQTALSDVSNVVQATSGQVATTYVAEARGPRSVRRAPVVAQATVLFNSARSYERFLLALLLPVIVIFGLTLSVTAAFGRELRDGTAAAWLESSGNRLLPAAIGKVFPYIALFFTQGVLSVIWVALVGGGRISGSVMLLVAAMALMCIGYAAIGLLLAGGIRNMATALSMVSVYAGTALPYSGRTFPVNEASTFVQVWNHLLPFTSYVKVQAQQLDMGAPVAASLGQMAALIAFIAIPGALGLRLYARAVRLPVPAEEGEGEGE
jgi:ABC-2 type transport system permease protein